MRAGKPAELRECKEKAQNTQRVKEVSCHVRANTTNTTNTGLSEQVC